MALLALLAMASVGILDGCKRDRYVPTECIVWSEKDGVVNGQIYIDGNRASFSAGASRSDAGYLNSAGHVVVVMGRKTIDAAAFDGQALKVLYIKDSSFTSEPIANGRVVFSNGIYRSEFRYNQACSVPDAAVGAVTLLTLVFPPGGATTL